MFFLVFLDFILLVEEVMTLSDDLFSGNEAKISDLILLYNCPYKLSYILSDNLFINSLNWSLDIGITGEEVVEVLEGEGREGIDEVLEEQERGTEGIEEESKTLSDEESKTLSDEGSRTLSDDDVNPNSDSDNGL